VEFISKRRSKWSVADKDAQTVIERDPRLGRHRQVATARFLFSELVNSYPHPHRRKRSAAV